MIRCSSVPLLIASALRIVLVLDNQLKLYSYLGTAYEKEVTMMLSLHH